MKNDENKEQLPHERKMPFDGIQLAYALFIVMYFRAAPHFKPYTDSAKLLGYGNDKFMILLFVVFAVFTVFVIVHNHKHEQNKITRWESPHTSHPPPFLRECYAVSPPTPS